MRIGIDAHTLGTRSGGNETYMRGLLRALAAHPPARGHEVLALVGPDGPGDPDAVPPAFARVPLPVRSSYLRVPFTLPWMARRLGLDLLHVQYTAPPVCPCPYVVSLHDAIVLRHPESMPFADRHRLRLLSPRTLGRAARVFVLTRAMRDELHRFYGTPLDRFSIVSPAPDPDYRPDIDPDTVRALRGRLGLDGPYLLYVGQLQPRKNLPRLARAFATLADRGFDHRLVIAGRRAWLYDDLLREIEDLRLGERLFFTDYLPRPDLPALYAGAAAFVYPSLYEGFGIPVLEALACGVPVLTSTDPALAEVAGGAALHVEPNDVEALREGLVRVLSDEALRTRLRQIGPVRAAAFTEAGMAAAAWAGYGAALTAGKS